MENSFGTEPRLSITAGRRGEKTVLEDCFFRAPFKIMKPFCPEGTEGMELMMALNRMNTKVMGSITG